MRRVPEPPADETPLLPESSVDDTESGWGQQPPYDDDARLVEDRPPHHDRD